MGDGKLEGGLVDQTSQKGQGRWEMDRQEGGYGPGPLR